MPFDQTSALAIDLVAWWKLNEASGTRASQTAVFPLAESGGTVGTRAGKIDEATRAVDTVSLQVAVSGALAPGASSYTVAGWFYIATANTDTFAIVDIGGSIKCGWENGANVWQAYVFSGALVQQYAQNIAPGGNIPRDTWIFFACVVNRAANTVRFYRNGVYYEADISAVGNLATSGNFMLFKDSSVGMDASADEWGVWSRALSDAEVLAIYNGGAGNTYSPNTAAMSASPSSIPYRTATAIALSGINTGWAPGATPFTLSGVPNTSILSTVINSPTSATVTILCDDDIGTLTISDAGNSISTTVEVIVDSTAVDAWPAKPAGYAPAGAGAVLNGMANNVGAKNGSNGNFLIMSAPLAIRAAGGTHAKFRLGNATSNPITYQRIAIWSVARNGSGTPTGKTLVGQLAFGGLNTITLQPGEWVDSDPLTVGAVTGAETWCYVVAIPRPEIGQPALSVDTWGYSDASNDPDGTGKLFGVTSVAAVDLTNGAFFDTLSGGSEFVQLPVITYLEGASGTYVAIDGDSKSTMNGLAGGWAEGALPDLPYGNAAQNGDTLGNLTSASPNRLNRARREWLKAATHTISAYGTNDFGGALSTTAAHAANLTTRFSYTASAYNFVVTISPQTMSAGGAWAENNQAEKVVSGVNVSQRIDAMNALITANYRTYGAQNYIELYRFEKADGTLLWRAGSYGSDGIHEGTVGVQLFRSLVYNKMHPLAALTAGGGSVGNGNGENYMTVTQASPDDPTIVTSAAYVKIGSSGESFDIQFDGPLIVRSVVAGGAQPTPDKKGRKIGIAGAALNYERFTLTGTDLWAIAANGPVSVWPTK